MSNKVETTSLADIGGTTSQYGTGRLNAEPTNGLGDIFGNLLNGLAGAAGSGLGSVTGLGDVSGLGTYAQLMRDQLRVQQEMQVVNFFSNTEKSKHETAMAPIRNIKS